MRDVRFPHEKFKADKTPSPEGSIGGYPVRPTPILGAYPSKNATKLAKI
jgi:hypothetical protein